jgi:predicted nucleic acid-binding protein
MPIVDSSFIIDLLRGNKGAHKKLAEMEAECSPLSTTIINVLELYRGAYLSRRTNQNLEETKKLLKSFQILKLEESDYEVFAFLSASLILRGKSIGEFDELIAAIALCNNEKIVTRDSHFKEVPGLDVINY